MTFNKRKDIAGLFNNEPPIFMGSNKLSFILDNNSNLDELLDLWRYSREIPNTFDKIVFGDRTNRSTVKIKFHTHDLLKKLLIDFTYKNKRLIIDKKVEFINIDFEDGLYCENIIFLKDVFFHNCTFKNVLIKTCSLPCLLIKFGKISDNMEIIDIKSAKVTITQVRTTPDTLLRIVNNLIILLSIDNLILQSWGEIKNSKIIRLSLKDLTLNSNLIINNTYFKCKNWQTACILKNEELKRNNFVESLKFQAEEKKLLEIELNDNKTLSNLSDRFSLLLGKIVNDHGQDWGKAVWFTLGVLFFTFAIFSLPNPLYYINSELNIFCSYWGVLTSKEFWGDLVKYISPTEYELLSKYIKTSSAHEFIKLCGIGVYMLGKIFIPYGVYEVIKAFRKYK